METPSSVEVQHKLSCEGAWSWKPPRALKVGQWEAVGAPLPLRSRGEPGGRFLIPKMPALPNVSQQRRLPHYWWPRSLHWEALNQQYEKKTESPSLPTANPLHSPHVSLPVDLCNNEVLSRIRHGAMECYWGRQNGEGAENKEVILDYEINQERTVPGEQTNDHVIEKNWMVGKQSREEVPRMKSTKAFGKPRLLISQNTKSWCWLCAAEAQWVLCGSKLAITQIAVWNCPCLQCRGRIRLMQNNGQAIWLIQLKG